ncbi:putative fungal pheromone GPCR, STE3-type [Sparassis latifolia]
MAASPYPLFSVFAFIGFVVGLIPFSWHIQAWNAGTCVYMIWSSFACLIEFVDSIVWYGNTKNYAPVWCDISTKFLIGAGVGIPASSLCINRRLYKIASGTTVSVSRKEKRNAIFIDLGVSVGIPILVMILHYVVLGHRFNILEDVGCVPEIFNTPAAYVLVFMWPVLLGCISFVYASLTLRAFWMRRTQFNELLSGGASLTAGRYFRLMLLSCSDMACTIPLSSYSMYIGSAGVNMEPYISWSNVHYDFSNVEQIPAIIWQSSRSYTISVELSRWIYPFSALLFFALFGFAGEARRHYRLAFWAVARYAGLRPPASPVIPAVFRANVDKGNKLASDDTLPEYTPRSPVRRKRPQSLSCSIADSVIDIDIEKALQSPLSGCTTIYCEDGLPSAKSQQPSQELPSSSSFVSHAPSTPTTEAVHATPSPHTLAPDAQAQVAVPTESL